MGPAGVVRFCDIVIRSTSSVQWVSPPAMTALGDPPTAVGVVAVMKQSMVCWPQLAGLIAAPGRCAQGRIACGPMPLAARKGAVIVIVSPPGGAGAAWADAPAGTATAAAMISPPPAAATAI